MVLHRDMAIHTLHQSTGHCGLRHFRDGNTVRFVYEYDSQPDHGGSAVFKFEIDSGILLVETSGFWTVDEADAYMGELRLHLDAMRRRNGYSLILVDGRQAQVQTGEVMSRMDDIQSVLVSGDRDRAAYVVVNSIAKLQAQRLSRSENLKVFLSPEEARAWLIAP